MPMPVLQPAAVLPLVPGRDLAPASAPRPYFHPVRSLAGTVLTEVAPADHVHHLGLSIAFSDLNGTNFWGGSTYTPDSGPVLLANHGSQELQSWSAGEGAWSDCGERAGGTVLWRGEHGALVAEEQRTARIFAHPDPATWALTIESVMIPSGGIAALEVSSSAVRGRSGAGYGGIFWRFPADCSGTRVFSAAGEGVEAAHGSRSPWLAISTVTAGAPVTVVLARGDAARAPNRPWFIRSEGYLGAGPAVAWSEKAVADAAHPLVQVLHAVIHDGAVASPDHALHLLENHPALRTPSHSDRTP